MNNSDLNKTSDKTNNDLLSDITFDSLVDKGWYVTLVVIFVLVAAFISYKFYSYKYTTLNDFQKESVLLGEIKEYLMLDGNNTYYYDYIHGYNIHDVSCFNSIDLYKRDYKYRFLGDSFFSVIPKENHSVNFKPFHACVDKELRNTMLTSDDFYKLTENIAKYKGNPEFDRLLLDVKNDENISLQEALDIGRLIQKIDYQIDVDKKKEIINSF